MTKVSILENLEYSTQKVQITPLLESDVSKEIRIVFTKDQIMKDHKTRFPITVEIFDGKIDFGVGEKVYALEKGDIVTLEANVMHNLKALENSIVRLTLNKADSVNRVQGVLKL